MAEAESGTKSELRQEIEGKSLMQNDLLGPVEELRDIDPSLLNADTPGEQYRDVFLSLFERSGIGLAVLDSALRVRSVNSALSAQCGMRPEEMRGRDFAEFLHPSVRQYVLRQFGRLVQGRKACLGDLSIDTCFDHTAVSGELTAFPVEDDSGRVEAIMAQFTPGETAGDHHARVRPQGKLTPLSAKVLEGVAAGDPTVRLAAKLFLSRQGIEYHVGALLRQFDVPNRTALAAKAYSMGMFSMGCWPPRLRPGSIRSDPQGADRAGGETRTEARRP
ncbi:PAS domain-containing protein [Streptomyces sp. NBC_01320]|uniref:PAS domain-containing protein n=1 Tax=Streptomyces sp. NBC_01320 TaxID=2903824 RepID=UPI002E0D7C88|nr:PAS domain-containing protein [Streptomyces sp. NBC_01320]